MWPGTLSSGFSCTGMIPTHMRYPSLSPIRSIPTAQWGQSWDPQSSRSHEDLACSPHLRPPPFHPRGGALWPPSSAWEDPPAPCRMRLLPSLPADLSSPPDSSCSPPSWAHLSSPPDSSCSPPPWAQQSAAVGCLWAVRAWTQQ